MELTTFKVSCALLLKALSLFGYKNFKFSLLNLQAIAMFFCSLMCAITAYPVVVGFCYKRSDNLIINMFIFINIFMCSGKCLVLIVRRQKFSELIEYFDEQALKIEMLEDREQNESSLRAMRKAFVWTRAIFSGFSLIIVPFVLSPIVCKVSVLPVPNTIVMTQYMMIDFSFQCFGFAFAALSSSLFNAFYISCSIFLALQIEISRYHLIMLDCKKSIMSQLKSIVDRHSAVLRANSFMNDLFGKVLFVQLIISTAALCFAMVYIQDYQALTIVPVQLLEIILFCYFGQKIHDQNSLLADAFYSTSWIEMSPRERKWILLGFRQAQRPLYSKAGPLINISHETLKSVFQSAYSFYTVLK